MLARVPRSRSTKDIDLASGTAADLAEAESALTALVAVDLGDHLTFRLIRSAPAGMGDNQPGVLTRRLVFPAWTPNTTTQIDTIMVDIVVGPPPVGRPEDQSSCSRGHRSSRTKLPADLRPPESARYTWRSWGWILHLEDRMSAVRADNLESLRVALASPGESVSVTLELPSCTGLVP